MIESVLLGVERGGTSAHYTLRTSGEKGYVAGCPALPGLVTEGETYGECKARVVEAIEGYLESLQKDGLPIAEDKKLTLELSSVF